MVSRESLDRYSAASTRAVDLAKRDLERFWSRLDLTNPNAARDALLEFVPTLVSTYGDLVATAAMEWYDEERAKVPGLPEYRASSDVYTTSAEQAAASTRYAAGHLYTDNQAAALAVLEGTVHKLVKDAGRDVIARNVRLDPAHPRYARVPRGAKTCAWCSILASRGWVYVSKESAALHGKGHAHCDCELVPSWKANEAYMRGYDPDKMYAQYNDARHAVMSEGGDPNDLKVIAAKARSLHPGAYTDGAGVPRSSVSETRKSVEERLKKDLSRDAVLVNSPRAEIVGELRNRHVESRPVLRLDRELSSEEIAKRLSGGDTTEGSCASLALAYAGNRAGLDVLDYRGGNSRDVFSLNVVLRQIVTSEDVISFIETGSNEIRTAAKIIEKAEIGREYLLIAGEHAAIVRRTSENLAEWLELQSPVEEENTWSRLSVSVLQKRFACQRSRKKFGVDLAVPSMMADIESLGESQGYAELMSYINTAESEQVKGASGAIK